MAAPAVTLLKSFGFRDAKGFTARMSFIIGGATSAAVDTAAGNLLALLQAATNCHAWRTEDANKLDKRTLGTIANYQNVSDKARLTFIDSQGSIHTFGLPAPLTTDFDADQETVNNGDANMSALIGNIEANCYGSNIDTAPLSWVGGVRTRGKMRRKQNIFTKAPDDSGPGE